MKLVVSPEAAADLERLHAFLASTSATAAVRAAAAIDEAVESLSAFPGRGRPIGAAGIQELIVPFGSSAYVLRYAYLPEAETIVILRIWHSREQR